MDPFTHALASYTLKRAAFPCAPRSTTIAMLIAGAIADIDLLSAYFSPSVFLTFNRTYFHSLVAGLLFSLLVPLPFVLPQRGSTVTPTAPPPIFISAPSSPFLHLSLGLCHTTARELFWPLST